MVETLWDANDLWVGDLEDGGVPVVDLDEKCAMD